MRDEQFPEYTAVNTQYADTIGALDELQSSIGRKIDISGPHADKALGTELRKLMSNYNTRINLNNAISVIEDTAGKYGKTYDDNVKRLVLFADELDRKLGPVARTSFESLSTRAAERGARVVTEGASPTVQAAGVAADVITGKTKGRQRAKQEKEYRESVEAMRKLLKKGAQ